jgi:hypothetical protein
MTVLVYGAVALLVKIDDMGLALMKSPARGVRRTGARIVHAMPAVFKVISIIGTVAMLWVGGHLVIANLAETFWHGPHDVVHAVTHAVEAAGPVVVWLAGRVRPGSRPDRRRHRHRRHAPAQAQPARSRRALTSLAGTRFVSRPGTTLMTTNLGTSRERRADVRT